MLPYTAPSSTWLTPPTDCCFMWLQLYSFQNILSNRFQQRPWPLVVGVHKEEGGEGGPHLPTVPLKRFVSVWEKTSTYRITANQRAPSAYTVFSTRWARAITVFRVYIVTVLLNIISYKLVLLRFLGWSSLIGQSLSYGYSSIYIYLDGQFVDGDTHCG